MRRRDDRWRRVMRGPVSCTTLAVLIAALAIDGRGGLS
jgi:hypothetical protein